MNKIVNSVSLRKVVCNFGRISVASLTPFSQDASLDDEN